MSKPLPFPGAPTIGFFYQVKTFQIAGMLKESGGKLGKIGEMYEILSHFMTHNEYPYFYLYSEVYKIYESKFLPFWNGFLPKLQEIQNADDAVINKHMDQIYGEGWKSSQSALENISALILFTKNNPIGKEKEQIHILSCILWSIYISVHNDSMFDELYRIFKKADKLHGHLIKGFDPQLN